MLRATTYHFWGIEGTHLSIEQSIQQQTGNAAIGTAILHTQSITGGKMKTLMYVSVVALLTLLSLPTTSDAFSRRSSSSDFTPMQGTTAPVNTNTSNASAQAVPEPPVLLLMSIGLGVFGLGYAIKGYRKQS